MLDPKEAFDKFLALLHPNRERAGEEYEKLRQRLIFYFERRGCRTAAERADETINRVIGKLAGGEELRSVASYCGGVARNVLREYWDDPRREWAELDEAASDSNAIEDPREIEREREAEQYEHQRRECMRQCLQRLAADDRELMLAYCTTEQRADLAAQLAITLNALRIRVNRVRDKLRRCAADCLKKMQPG
jgi:DNA-directed RNA polymerase specialized sigma24 family protein